LVLKNPGLSWFILIYHCLSVIISVYPSLSNLNIGIVGVYLVYRGQNTSISGRNWSWSSYVRNEISVYWHLSCKIVLRSTETIKMKR